VTKTLTQVLEEYESLTKAERDSIPLEDFAWPEERKYPIDTQDHLDSAATLIGHAPETMQPKIKARAIRIAKRHNFTLPDAWKDGGNDEKQESAATIASTATRRPLKKIATLRVCWLEHNARSLNGRIYPKQTCDRIYESAQRKLASNDLPITCFVSHEAANGNANTELVGRAVKIWQEGTKFWADLDLADTRTAWDMLALAEGGYLRSESMRVLGVELAHDRNYDLPLVIVQEGVEPELLGIDLTTRPGLMDTARIQQVLYESSQNQEPYTESFPLDSVLVESKEEVAVSDPLYLQIIAGTMTEAMTADRQAHQRVHDHLAGVLDECLKPMHGSESTRLRALVESELTEAGRALAMKHAKRLADAHDAAASACGMDCEGCYKEALGIPLDPDRDGDTITNDTDHDNESVQKGQEEMTEQEMLAALKAKGYAVTAPKTVQEELEELRAKVAVLEESRTTGEPQRQTQAPSAMTETSTLTPESLYEEGEYLAGTLKPTNWKALSNRRVPWPQGVDPSVALHELAPFMAFRLLETEANAMGRNIDTFIGAHDRV
jgi:hypothetical protein